MDSQTLEDFQQKWEAVAAAEPSQTSGGRSEKAQRQQRLSLACTLAREYLALGLPPPPSTAALTGHALEHYRKHKLQRKPRASAEVLERLREALTAQEQFLRTQQAQVATFAEQAAHSRGQDAATASHAQDFSHAQAFEAQNQAGNLAGDLAHPGRPRGKSARRAELQAAVHRLRDALQAADGEAGQQAADQVAMLLRSQASVRSYGVAMHGTQTETPRARSPSRHTIQGPSAFRTTSLSPRPDRRSSYDAMTQTNGRRPYSATGSPSKTWNATQSLHRKSSRDAACSPPPRPRTMGEASLRFHTRPEWDDSFHLTSPSTPRPPRRQVFYAVDDAYSPRNATSAAQKLSVWRNAKRVEQARSLSPKREVPTSLTLMSTALRSQSPLRRTMVPAGFTTTKSRLRTSTQGTHRSHVASPRPGSGPATLRPGATGPRSQTQQLQRVEDLEARMSKLIAAVEQRLAATTTPEHRHSGLPDDY